MIEVNALRKGTTFTQNDELFKVLDYSHSQVGRGGATIRVKVRNLRSGATLEKTFNDSERVQDIRLEYRDSQYLYNDDDFCYFMDIESFEQPAIAKELLTDILPYMTDNMLVKLCSYNEELIDVEIPITVDLEVVESEPSFAGDTAQGATKQVTVSTGLVVQTPLFVDVGDTIRIDTRTGQYLARA